MCVCACVVCNFILHGRAGLHINHTGIINQRSLKCPITVFTFIIDFPTVLFFLLMGLSLIDYPFLISARGYGRTAFKMNSVWECCEKKPIKDYMDHLRCILAVMSMGHPIATKTFVRNVLHWLRNEQFMTKLSLKQCLNLNAEHVKTYRRSRSLVASSPDDARFHAEQILGSSSYFCK